MSEHNGAHLNGHTPPLPSGGGKGEVPMLQGIRSPAGAPAGMDARMIGRGLREGWLKPWSINPDLAEKLPIRLDALTQSDDDRIVVRAATVLVQMAKHNLELVQAVDNAGRLNDGDATERIEIVYRKPERQVIDE